MFSTGTFWITLLLEHNLFQNVSKWVTFLWQTQIQTLEYGLNDAKRIKKKQVTLILYSFTPSDMNFQTILMPKVILAKFVCFKNSSKIVLYFSPERTNSQLLLLQLWYFAGLQISCFNSTVLGNSIFLARLKILNPVLFRFDVWDLWILNSTWK